MEWASTRAIKSSRDWDGNGEKRENSITGSRARARDMLRKRSGITTRRKIWSEIGRVTEIEV